MKTASKLIALMSLGLATLLGGGCDNQSKVREGLDARVGA